MTAHLRNLGATTDDEGDTRFEDLCEGIFEEDGNNEKILTYFAETTQKIEAVDLREEVRSIEKQLAINQANFFFAVGYAFAQDYKLLDPEAQEEIEYLRKRIREAGMFPVLIEGNNGFKIAM